MLQGVIFGAARSEASSLRHDISLLQDWRIALGLGVYILTVVLATLKVCHHFPHSDAAPNTSHYIAAFWLATSESV